MERQRGFGDYGCNGFRVYGTGTLHVFLQVFLHLLGLLDEGPTKPPWMLYPDTKHGTAIAVVWEINS